MRLKAHRRRTVATTGMGWGLMFTLLLPLVSAQVTTTTVTGTVYLADGATASGTLLVSWPAFSTATNQAVAAGTTSVAIGANGAVSLNLAPNRGAYPAGTYYTAVYHLSDGTTSREYWVIPAAASTTISAVRAQLAPATVAVQPVSKSYVDGSISAITANYVPIAGGTMSGPLQLSADPVSQDQAATKHYADALAAAELPLTGGSLSGPLNSENTVGKLPRVDVRHPDFGAGCANAADPSGQQDSTCAIQAAIAWAENNEQGGNFPPVYFAPGTYKVSGNLIDNGSIQYYADDATLAIAAGTTVSIGGESFSGAEQLPKAVNAPATGPTDSALFNPTRTGRGVNNIVGGFRRYNWSGTIPANSLYNNGQLFHYGEDFGALDTTPGCWGFAPGASCYDTQHGLRNEGITVNGGGGTNGYTFTGNFYSVGDHIGHENYVSSFGGSVDGGGPEGTKGESNFVSEMGNTWTGVVASGHGGAEQTTLYATCLTDCGTVAYGVPSAPGISAGAPASVGQGMIITDEQTTTASGQIESFTGGSGEAPGTMTVNITSGLTNLVVSTCEATLSSNLNPTVNPSGSGSQTLTFTVNDVSGTCTAGGLMSFAGTNHEQAVIASATAPSGGQQTITANLRLCHESGSYLFENANSDAGLQADMVANDNGTLKFPVEVLGVQSISGNTAVMWWRRWYAATQPSFVSFPAGYAVIGAGGVSNLSNTGGTATFAIFQNAFVSSGSVPLWQVINHASAIYISNASNAAFDGPCTNVNVSMTSNPGMVTCTQSASNGQTATSATVSLTDSTLDNPYGNSRVNFYRGAAVIDPQDYSAPEVVNGVRNYPVDGKQFQIEPNAMALNPGDALVEHHSEPQFHNYEGDVGVANPTCYVCNGMNLFMSGVFGNQGGIQNGYMYGANNTTSNSAYSYFGGAMNAIPVFMTQGMWADFLYMKQPPSFGSAFLHSPNCPPSPSSCTDTTYYYDLYNFAGNGGSNSAQYFPATNTMMWGGLHRFSSGVAVGGSFAAAEINGEVTVDGATYSTLNAAWSAAVALAGSSGKSQTVRLGPGLFNVSATMTEPSNGTCVNLIGSGGTTVNAGSAAATTLNVPASLGGGVFSLGNAAQAQGCTFRDFVVLANAHATHGFDMQWFRGLLIDNVAVNDTTAEGLLLGEEAANGHQSNFLLRNITVSYNSSLFSPASRAAYGVHLQKTAIDSYMDDVVVRNALTAAVYNEGTGNTGYLVHGFGFPYTCTTGPCANNVSSGSAANASYATAYVIDDVGGGGSVWTDTYADSPSVAGFYVGANGVSIRGGHIQWPDLTSFPAANLAYVAAGVTNNLLIADVSCLGMNSGVNWITYAGASGNPPTFSSVHNLTGCGNYVQDLNPAEVTGFSSGGANINDPTGAVPRVWSTPIAAASSYPAYSAQLYTGYQGDVLQGHFSGVNPFFNVTYQGTIKSEGGLALSTIINTASTLTLTAANKNVIANAASGAQTITLPSCFTAWPDKASPTGLEFTIIKSDGSANAVTLQTVSGQQINYLGVTATSLGIASAGKRTLVCAPDFNWYAY
ncbi:MAG TPA: glycosyl hydrolase family 28-related protein [Silvibacterium sp.]|nr:glycosyl hydrolase family 28-related protein [Silvibacterium sp.]